MPKKVPDCRSCEHCYAIANFEGGSLHPYCLHPVLKFIHPTGRKWITSRERGKTSPTWCPLRINEEVGRTMQELTIKYGKEGARDEVLHLTAQYLCNCYHASMSKAHESRNLFKVVCKQYGTRIDPKKCRICRLQKPLKKEFPHEN